MEERRSHASAGDMTHYHGIHDREGEKDSAERSMRSGAHSARQSGLEGAAAEILGRVRSRSQAGACRSGSTMRPSVLVVRTSITGCSFGEI